MMTTLTRSIAAAAAAAAAAFVALVLASAAAAEPRIALVLGNTAYERGPISNSLADAGLVAEALNSTGFEIMEGADLNQTDLRRTFADFLARVDAAGPDAIAFIYFSGYALEFEGENYLVPVDARLARENDIPLEAVRVTDLMRPLAASPARAKIVVLDAARPLPLTIDLAPGLSAMKPPPGMVLALASAPGTYADDSGQTYGAYAAAMAEMVREPGVDLDIMFEGIRMRTHGLTQGRQTPWHDISLPEGLVLVPGDDSAAPALVAPAFVQPDIRPMNQLDPEQAYSLAVQLDTLPSYVEYVDVYPESIYAPRVWAIIRTRREALVWARARDFDTREAYWTYLSRYPDGIYAADAQRRLRRLAAVTTPPSGFAPLQLGVPPPLAREPHDHVAVYAPLTRVPQRLTAPPPAYLASLPPPGAPRGPRLLPAVGIPPVPRMGQPPPRIGPSVTVVAPAATAPAAIAVPRRFGTVPPGAAQPAGSAQPAGADQLGGYRRPVTTRPMAPANGAVAPNPYATVAPNPYGGAPNPYATVPTTPPNAAVVPRNGTPQVTPQQSGAPASPAVRMVPQPLVPRPVPPVVRPPAVVAHPPQQVPAQPREQQSRCRIINGVERCG